jgi:molybdate transport system substrate-binding protein
VYAQGRLGLWSPTLGLASLKDLLRPDIRSIAVPNPAHAPYGAAAIEMLRKAGLLDKLRSKLVYGENVRQAYEFARTGNADASITSWTLLQNVEGARQLPAHLHPAIRQAAGIVASSKNQRAAKAFLDYLLGPIGQAILRKGGLDQP